MPRILNHRHDGLLHKKIRAKGAGHLCAEKNHLSSQKPQIAYFSGNHENTMNATYLVGKRKGGNLAAYLTDADSDSQTTDDLQDYSSSDSLWNGSATNAVEVHSRDDDLVDDSRVTNEKDKKKVNQSPHVDDWGHFVEIEQRELDFISIKTRLTPILSVRKKSKPSSGVREREKKSHLFGRSHLFGI
jgi:hypothetical protein